MTETATPNDMPGAAPADTASPEPKQEAKGVNDQISDSLNSDDVAAELARLRKIHADESKWEKRAKQNFEDAQRYRELTEKLGGKEAKEFDAKVAFEELNAKLEAAERERARAEVARTKQVNPKFIQGKTVDEMVASADDYLADVQQRIDEALKAKNPTPPPASTVTANGKIAGPEQITSREELAKLSPEERAKAYEDGRLDSLMGKTT